MLYLDLHFFCTQRLMTPISSNIQKGSLEDRVCAIFSSVFLLVDASFHLLAAAYKGFHWTVSQISRKNPSDYYKEAYSHFVKALCCASIIPFGSLVGVVDPSILQSKKLQEYLGWKASLTDASEITENNQTLEEELQSKNEEIKRLKPQVDSLKEITVSTASQNNLESPEKILVSTNMVNPGSSSRKSIISLGSEDDVFLDAIEETSDLNETLEEELQSKNEEIKRLKSQINLLNKILSPLETLHPYNQVLVIQKTLNKSITDTPAIYEYLSDPVKREINDAFQPKLNMSFPQYCAQINPDVDSASDIFTGLLSKHTFWSCTSPKEASISAVINTLFGFV